jgi:hypothetical protein
MRCELLDDHAGAVSTVNRDDGSQSADESQMT